MPLVDHLIHGLEVGGRNIFADGPDRALDRLAERLRSHSRPHHQRGLGEFKIGPENLRSGSVFDAQGPVVGYDADDIERVLLVRGEEALSEGIFAVKEMMREGFVHNDGAVLVLLDYREIAVGKEAAGFEPQSDQAEVLRVDTRHVGDRKGRVGGLGPARDIERRIRNAMQRQVVDHSGRGDPWNRADAVHQRAKESGLTRAVGIASLREVDVDRAKPRGFEPDAGRDQLMKAAQHESGAGQHDECEGDFDSDQDLAAANSRGGCAPRAAGLERGVEV